MTRRLRQRFAPVITILLFLAGGPALWLRLQQRQYALDRRLIGALIHGGTHLALGLVKAGADPNTPLVMPSAPSLRQLCSRLLHRSSLPANHSPTALLIACGDPWTDDYTTSRIPEHDVYVARLVQTMLAHGATVNVRDEDQRTPLLAAVRWSDSPNTEIVRLLLEHGADVNARDNFGERPLGIVLYHRATPYTVRLLVEHGADVNLENEKGEMPLIEAAFNSDPETVRLLLQHGANVDARQKGDGTALMEAVDNPESESVRALLDYGADVNARDVYGATALTYAVQSFVSPPEGERTPPGVQADIVRQLLAHGADPDIPANSRETARSLAKRANRSDILALLRQGAPHARSR